MLVPMTDAIGLLLTLQDRDQRLRALHSELARIPAERKLREKQLADCAARLEKSKARLREIEVGKKNLEVEAGAKREAIERYRSQQLQTRKNEEYTALQHEIQAAEKDIVAIEDRELALMEEAEALAPDITAAEAEHASEQEKIAKAIGALEGRAANIREKIQEMDAGRAAACEGLDEDLLESYERLFESKGGGAVVAVEHDVCTGCHMRVTSQTALEAKAGKGIVHCPNCGRILYLPA
jgi:uncharacterized protein